MSTCHYKSTTIHIALLVVYFFTVTAASHTYTEKWAVFTCDNNNRLTCQTIVLHVYRRVISRRANVALCWGVSPHYSMCGLFIQQHTVWQSQHLGLWPLAVIHNQSHTLAAWGILSWPCVQCCGYCYCNIPLTHVV